MEYLEYGTAHWKLGCLYDEMSLRQEDKILIGYIVAYLVGSYKGYKYCNFNCGIDEKV